MVLGSIAEAREIRSTVHRAVKQAMVLEDDLVLDLMLAAFMCKGHILLDDIPGVGKTLLARTFARCLGLSFKRIQFTPDLLPSDITGLSFYNQKNSDFEFRPGPVFTNILLADEINRATPRTQASLLECMQEATVSVDGETRSISPPFLVIATQNPVEMEGTFPLPEAQLDRFLFCLNLGYPCLEGERDIISRYLNDDPFSRVKAEVTRDEMDALFSAPSKVHVSKAVVDYALALSRATREMRGIRLGASPRGTLFLTRSAQALAALRDRHYVLPDDVQDVAVPVLAHRLVPDMESSIHESSGPRMIRQVLKDIPVPIGPYEEPS